MSFLRSWLRESSIIVEKQGMVEAVDRTELLELVPCLDNKVNTAQPISPRKSSGWRPSPTGIEILTPFTATKVLCYDLMRQGENAKSQQHSLVK